MSEFEVAQSGFEDLARSALLDVTDTRSVGPLVSEVDEGDGVMTLRFESNLPGYLGWKWAVSVAQIGDAAPTVLESELIPGDGALLAPEWVPWSDRLDEFNAGRAAAEADAESDEDDTDEDADDDLVDEEDLDDEYDADDEYDGVDVDAVLETADGADEDDIEIDDESSDVEDDEDDDLGEPDGEKSVDGSGAPAVGVDEAEQPEGDSGDAGPDPAGAVDADQSAQAEEQADERE
jgi:Protein of unknown function (DUF3027)